MVAAAIASAAFAVMGPTEVTPPFPRARCRQEGVSIFLDDDGYATPMTGEEQEQLEEPWRGRRPAAWGSFEDRIDETGWSILDVHTDEGHSGKDQSYAAGFLEGFLTHKRMKQHQRNMWSVDFNGRPSDSNIDAGASNFSAQNLDWMRNKAEQYGQHDPYWQQVGFVLEQLRGLTDGFNHRQKKLEEPSVSLAQVLMASVVDTDMDDLLTAIVHHGKFVNSHYRYHSDRPHRRSEPWKDRRHSGHCSALVQIAPNMSDLWAGHVTWDEYRGMLRVVKYLDMPLPGVKSRRQAFTSTPGCMYSGDDWYVTDTGLTVFETSIENYNRDLWDHVQPETVLTWMRTIVATRLATSGEEWTDLQLRYQSGTCNNQWMVVDYKRFHPGKPLGPGVLWISETMPGVTERADVTSVLVEQGSWPSYNIPYFRKIWKAGGYDLMMADYPTSRDQYSFKSDVRAKMFARARDEHFVNDLSSFAALLRYNKPGDPLAAGDTCNAISARCDLNPPSSEHYDCFGAIDGKIVSYRSDPTDLSFLAISGPTSSREEVPFTWSHQNTSVKGCGSRDHEGHPDTFDFSWYTMPSFTAGTSASFSAATPTTLAMEPPRQAASHSASAKVAEVSAAPQGLAAVPVAPSADLSLGTTVAFIGMMMSLVVALLARGFTRREAAECDDSYLRIEA